jgi:diacylglycerol O-acyltransferase
MRRLSGLDAGFLAMELPEQPMNTMALLLLRPPAPVRLDDVRRQVASGLDGVSEFRLMVKPVPLGLHQPVLVDAPRFNLDDHLAQADLPAPGGDADLDRLYGQLAAEHLDRRRPLWRLTLVDGLDDARQALILQVQHCLMDGAGTAAALARIFGSDLPGPNPGTWHAERPPSGLRLLVGGVARQALTLGRVPALLNRTRRGARAASALASASSIVVPVLGVSAPTCSINQRFTAQRRFARLTVDLAEVRAVKDAADATVNDVALAMVAGALRRYLLARDDLPAQPLVATVPVKMDGSGPAGLVGGNRLTRLTTSLATDVGDPWRRLALIRDVTREAKTRNQLTDPELLNDWLEVFPPFMVRFAVRRGQRRPAGGKGPDANVLISNMRGPAEPWSVAGAVAEEVYLTGSPNGGLGLTIALWDYAGKLRFAILATEGTLEDPSELVEALRASLQELVAAARGVPCGGDCTKTGAGRTF